MSGEPPFRIASGIRPASGTARRAGGRRERAAPDPRLVGLGTARPETELACADAIEVECALAPDERARRRVVATHRRSGVDRRGVVIAAPPGIRDFLATGSAAGPSTGARMQRYEAEAGALALRAARRALDDAGIDPGRVTHLVTASCTGFAAPGADLLLARELPLASLRERVHVGFMGCHAAINALRTARHLARSDDRAVVLVVLVELCSLHHARDDARERAVANALFADGAAAAIVAGAATDAAAGDAPGGEARPRLAGGEGAVLPGTETAMSWRIGDHGFEMHLDAAVPDLVASFVAPWTEDLCRRAGTRRGAVRSWIVHPGGPRLLDRVRDALDLDEPAIAPSREVLRTMGNMSSPTVLFVLERVRASLDAGPAVMLAFGPGLAAEGLVLVP